MIWNLHLFPLQGFEIKIAHFTTTIEGFNMFISKFSAKGFEIFILDFPTQGCDFKISIFFYLRDWDLHFFPLQGFEIKIAYFTIEGFKRFTSKFSIYGL